eukprot:CAMPEP_0115132570 /NCGR_PEP_ID=MMETSP0227-20121206/53835_1 /TAXON_ID=89957 /ORGANISM="Polarella glacialis, Strain CCMP 1383" /LENGTH=358 /DNA_ID=CAMNT_0002538395 /DNA_START=54 /DNA_END=1129 /DNA_ORIENTATION=-
MASAQPPLRACVKSRQRAIFDVPLAGLQRSETSHSSMPPVNRISGLRLTLESRIYAAGEAGQVAVEILLGRLQLCSGKALRHENLSILHLGPHLAGSGASQEKHLEALAAALQAAPQVVVLDEAQAAGDEAWAEIFNQLVTAKDVLQDFRGALVLSVAEETVPIRQLCSQRWACNAGWLWQEASAEDLLVEEDVLAEGKEHPLLQEVAELSKACFFEEDCVAKAREKGWVLTLLSEAAENGGERRLCGFMCHMLKKPPKAELHIARLAVVEQSRGRRHGRHLMQWILDKAASIMPRSKVAWISLSALDEAIPFYEQFGFTDMTCDNLEDEEHFQTWMELKNISVVPEDVHEDEDEDED